MKGDNIDIGRCRKKQREENVERKKERKERDHSEDLKASMRITYRYLISLNHSDQLNICYRVKK